MKGSSELQDLFFKQNESERKRFILDIIDTIHLYESTKTQKDINVLKERCRQWAKGKVQPPNLDAVVTRAEIENTKREAFL